MANVNRKWASGLGADGNPVYAPANVIEVNERKVYNPTDKHYRAAGYLPVVDYPPPSEHREGYHWERGAWQKVDGEITRLWDEVADPPPPPRVFVTADLVEALMAEGIYQQVRDWIVEQGMLDLVLATKEFDENNENFQAGKTALQTALGWTDEQVEELLSKCVKEGY